MESITYLAIAYLGMLFALGLWTYIVATRHNRLKLQLESMQEVMDNMTALKDDSENEE
ncbi:MAG: hypothetical protein VW270_19925 [Candidatus Poseidoniales archaeon]